MKIQGVIEPLREEVRKGLFISSALLFSLWFIEKRSSADFGVNQTNELKFPLILFR